MGGIAVSIERAVFTEELARRQGPLQRLDPRAKLGMFLVLVLAASLSHALGALLALYAVLLLVARVSRVPLDILVARVWLGIPLFAGIVIIPSIFLTGGSRLFDLSLGPVTFSPSALGAFDALIFVTRVGVCVSLAVLLVVTTPWADVLKSLQALRVPQIFTLILAMTYRYIFLFLHMANGMMEARKSRMVGRSTGKAERRWIAGAMGTLLHRSFAMSSDVYAAMIARGFHGEVRTYSTYRMQVRDWLALVASGALAVGTVVAGRYIR